MQKLTRGDSRADGMIFWSYASGRNGNQEWWMTPQQFLDEKQKLKKRDEAGKALIRENIAANGKKSRGLVRDDGMVFWGYRAERANGEVWLTLESFKKKLAQRAETNRKWNAANAEKMTELKRAWDAKNPERVKAQWANIRFNRRSRKCSNGGKATKDELLALKKAAKGTCFYCHKKAKLSYDHVTPLKLGGTNSITNMVMACIHCNSQKQAKDPLIYARQIGRLLI